MDKYWPNEYRLGELVTKPLPRDPEEEKAEQITRTCSLACDRLDQFFLELFRGRTKYGKEMRGEFLNDTYWTTKMAAIGMEVQGAVGLLFAGATGVMLASVTAAKSKGIRQNLHSTELKLFRRITKCSRYIEELAEEDPAITFTECEKKDIQLTAVNQQPRINLLRLWHQHLLEEREVWRHRPS